MDEQLEQRYELWLRDLAAATDRLAPDAPRIDLHAHIGVDAGSGLEMTWDALHHQLRVASVEEALLIPLNASDGYHRDSLRLIERAKAGNHHALYRVDPTDDQLAEHAAEGLAAGAAGFKLHPVSDDSYPLDPRVLPAIEQAQEAGAMVFVHTGVDVERAAQETVEAARRHPGARFVLGHVPGESLAKASKETSELDNLWTCLSWWGAQDVAYAMLWSDSTRLLHGSDPPYGHAVTGLAQTVFVARALGWGDDRLAGVLSGNARAILDGDAPTHAGDAGSPSDGRCLLAELPLPFRRCYLGLLAAVSSGYSGGDPSAYYRFAGQGLERQLIGSEHREAADSIAESIDLASALHDADASAQAYAVGTGALTQALTLPTLASR